MTAFRLTLELAEETRARWQHAADRAGFTLDEWIRVYLGAASDPDAGQVTGTGTPGAQQTQSDNQELYDAIVTALRHEGPAVPVGAGGRSTSCSGCRAEEALDAFLARLTTAEQERDRLGDASYDWEMRANAAESALGWYRDHKRDDGSYDGELFGDLDAFMASSGTIHESPLAQAGARVEALSKERDEANALAHDWERAYTDLKAKQVGTDCTYTLKEVQAMNWLPPGETRRALAAEARYGELVTRAEGLLARVEAAERRENETREFAIGALRSNQDVLLHKIPRTPVVAEQLAVNLAAIRSLSARAALACPPEERPETLTEQVDRAGREFAAEVRSLACPPQQRGEK